MGDVDRFEIFFEKHIGVGIRWSTDFFAFHLSIAIPFVTVTIGFGQTK